MTALNEALQGWQNLYKITTTEASENSPHVGDALNFEASVTINFG
ncbi:MAG: hypothetical protein AAB929_02095 [Patescibacteria group bacterium]